MSNRGRGRPKGTGRWTDFGDAQVWARIEIRRREGSDVLVAANALAANGFWQVRIDDDKHGSGEKTKKIWTSNPRRDDKDPRIALAREAGARDGDTRRQDTGEVLRQRYYIANRRRANDSEFRERCDWWLEVLTHGGDLLDE